MFPLLCVSIWRHRSLYEVQVNECEIQKCKFAGLQIYIHIAKLQTTI